MRIGESRAGRALSNPVHDRRPFEPRFRLGGMAGEVGRAYWWKDRSPVGAVTPELLVGRMGTPASAEVLDAAAAWLDELPPQVRADGPTVLDLAYVEQRMGCWQAPSGYLFHGSPGRRLVVSPMAEALNIETMLGLPEDYRAAGVLQRDMVAYGWPELLAVAFNEPTGLLRLSGELNRIVVRSRTHLGRVRRRVRSRTGPRMAT